MKHIILAVLLVLAGTQGFACSVCGGSASNPYLGILPQFSDHFVSLQYQYRSFKSEHPGHGDDAPSFSNEYYNTVQIWGRANIGKRVQLFGFVPYVSNISEKEGVRTQINGLGDITLLGNVRIAGLNSAGKTWQHNLQVGGGIKLPTGKYDSVSIRVAEGLPNMQPGTNSWDWIANANYTIRRRSVGMNVDVSYTFTMPNSFDYKYGNRMSTGLLGFYWYEKGNIILMPQAGLRFDITAKDYDNYTYGLINDMTGGEQLYATAGVQAYYKRIGYQLMYHQPVAQYYASGLVDTKVKFETGLFLLF